MQQFKKIILSTLLGSVLSINVHAQKDVVISGGSSVSSFVCINKKVYTWGNNKNLRGTGILGNGSTTDIVNTPTPVTFPDNINIQQVNSGSGDHFLALDCNGGVWAWGNNQFGQVGNNTSGNNVMSPSRVMLGVLSVEASTFDPTNTGFITKGVKVVYAGSENSFAILEDGRLISWGANRGLNAFGFVTPFGQLGDGTTINRATPVFVKKSNGNSLTGVKQVFAGDNVAYALVDTIGSGVGTVFSWGNGLNGTLGRNAQGTGNPATQYEVRDSVARPVYYKGNGGGTGRMDNITAISASDVFGMALDTNGYVWTWGNGAWNKSTGNTVEDYSGSDPRRVIAGKTIGASNNGTFLIAKRIAGGQGFGMAVSVDNKAVAWGGNSCSDGGLTGTDNITNAKFKYPAYIKFESVIHDDVIGIYRGDTWGYYQRADGTFYTWGCNSFGQLGIGNTVEKRTAVAFVPPISCSLPDPKPYVNLTSNSATVCASKLSTSPITLHSGFVISASLATNYIVTWKKETSTIQTGPATAANLTYSANSIGNYSVTIKYVGTNIGCVPYEETSASINISAYSKNFTTPSDLTYCGETGSVHVNSTDSTSIYKFYPTSISNTELGTSIGSAAMLIDLASAKTESTDKLVYVEQTSPKSGIAFKKSQACDTTIKSFSTLSKERNYPFDQSGFTTTVDNITLTTLNIRLKSHKLNSSNFSATLNFGVYGSKIGFNDKLFADSSKLIGLFTYDYSKAKTPDPQDSISDVLVTLNIKLPKAGVYFFSLKPTGLTSVVGTGFLSIGQEYCQQTVPFQSIPSGIISYTLNSRAFNVTDNQFNFNLGYFFNVVFKTSQGFCDRVPIILKEKCVATGFSEIDEKNNTIRISPSPFKDQFMLETIGMEKVSIFDQRGVLIEEKSLVNLKNIQLGQAWSSGLYMLQLVGNGTVKTVKVIKEQ